MWLYIIFEHFDLSHYMHISDNETLAGCIFESPLHLSRKKVWVCWQISMQLQLVSLFKTTIFFNFNPDILH